MLKNLLLLFGLVLVVTFITPSYCFAHGADPEFTLKGGTAVCKFTGGNEDFKRVLKLNENLVSTDETEGTLDIVFGGAFSGDFKGVFQDIAVNISTDLQGVDFDKMRPGKVYKFNTQETELAINLTTIDKDIVILGLMEDENKNPLTSEVSFGGTARKNKVKGIGKITFPRTIVIPREDFERTESGTEVSLDNAVENGPMSVVCKLKNVPLLEED